MTTDSSTTAEPLDLDGAASPPHAAGRPTRGQGSLRGADEADRVEELRRRLEGLLGIPATEGNALTVLRNGDEIFPAMLAEIRSATRTVDLLTFAYWKGDIAEEFASALSERASAGVTVRVLIDAVGGRLMESALLERMSSAGVQVEWFRVPVWQGRLLSPIKHNHRTHRKVLVCDEVVGFTGGVGIAEEWCGDARNEHEWRDTHVRVTGPAVDGLSAAFAQNWAETGHDLIERSRRFPEHERTEGGSCVQVSRGSASVGWNDMATVFRVMLESAQQRLRMMTAYFVPDDCFQQLMLEAVQRGVQVDVMLPGPHADKRVCQLASESIYSTLVEGGVRIWAFQPSMLHAKVLTVDGIAAVVGSANMNRRSMQHDEEVVLSVLDPAVARRLEQDFDDELPRCELITPRRWAERPLHQKAQEQATRVAHHFF
jgi:cardiolipin synthase